MHVEKLTIEPLTNRGDAADDVIHVGYNVVPERTCSSSSRSDLELLEAIRKDDEAAFAELFERYWKKVHDFALPRVRSQELTAEIVQDLFIALWDKRATHTIKHLPSYLYTAVKNRALNHMEAQMVRKTYRDYCLKVFSGWDNNTEKTVEFDDLMSAIESGMLQLPKKSRTVFRLNKLEGHSIPEIARTLNLSEKAIGYHLTQSLKKLRFHLKDYLVMLALSLLLNSL